ncbi:hypothetical protein E8E14_005653 [Neopestalotiopsis sp. 37M]|nr:hypothetical protein E8E14_005653 [Neopestalotiopsis sp. 37M]
MSQAYTSPEPMSDLADTAVGGSGPAANDESPYKQAAWGEACTWCFIFTDWNAFCSACGDLCSCECCDCDCGDCCSACDCGTCCDAAGGLCSC